MYPRFNPHSIRWVEVINQAQNYSVWWLLRPWYRIHMAGIESPIVPAFEIRIINGPDRVHLSKARQASGNESRLVKQMAQCKSYEEEGGRSWKWNKSIEITSPTVFSLLCLLSSPSSFSPPLLRCRPFTFCRNFCLGLSSFGSVYPLHRVLCSLIQHIDLFSYHSYQAPLQAACQRQQHHYGTQPTRPFTLPRMTSSPSK